MPLTKGDKLLMEYFWKSKRIPEPIPRNLLEEPYIPPKVLIATESNCFICDGPLETCPETGATIYGCGKKWKGYF